MPATQRAKIAVEGVKIDFTAGDENEIYESDGFKIHLLDVVSHPTIQFSYQFTVEISYTVLTEQVTVSCGQLAGGSVTKTVTVDG